MRDGAGIRIGIDSGPFVAKALAFGRLIAQRCTAWLDLAGLPPSIFEGIRATRALIAAAGEETTGLLPGRASGRSMA